MKLSVAILSLIVMSVLLPSISLALPTQPPSPSLTSQIPPGYYPTYLSFSITYNSSHQLNIYYVNYTIRPGQGGELAVNVSTNATTTVNGTTRYVFSFLRNGTFTVNTLEDVMNLSSLPYIYPGFLFNSTYGVSTPISAVGLIFKGELNTTFTGQKEYLYSVYLPNQLSGLSILLSDGVLYQLNSTYNGGELHLQLLEERLGSFPLELGQVPNQLPSGLQVPYIYSTYNFSPPAQALIPSGYVEFMPSTIFGNGLFSMEQAYVQYVELEPLTKAYVGL